MKRHLLFFRGLVSAALFIFSAGCSYESFDSASDLEAVVTNRQPEGQYDYAKNRTWTMPDIVADLSRLSDGGIESDSAYESVIMTAIAENMARLGYTYVSWPATFGGDTETADTGQTDQTEIPGIPPEAAALDVDVILLPAIMTSQTTLDYTYCYPYYYDSYYWCIYYPDAVYYRAQTVLIAMIDKGDIRADSEGQYGLSPVWSAAFYGLLDTANPGKIKNGIDQAFKQSAYLNLTAP